MEIYTDLRVWQNAGLPSVMIPMVDWIPILFVSKKATG
jgi:hypothetical protein